MKHWEITFLDTGKTVVWNTRKCHKFFGKAEFGEIDWDQVVDTGNE